eukprot:3585981-Karenia_brevis.AAC.1
MPRAVNSMMLSKSWLERNLNMARPAIFSLTLGLNNLSAWLSVQVEQPKCLARTKRVSKMPPALCTAR